MLRNTQTEKNTDKPVILIIDDQYQTFRSLPRLIDSEQFAPLWTPDEHEGLRIIKEQPDKRFIIIIDLKSSGMGGGGFLQIARQITPHSPILITGPLAPFLYLEGNFYELAGPNLKKDINTVLQSIADRTDGRRIFKKKKRSENKNHFGAMIGGSQSINTIYRLIDNLKDSSATVLIQGESGTGKELAARMIHQTSQRKDFPFVAINCGAIPANLIESELFGHERGAFTTAVQQRKGKFETAHQGTLFLDEIGELSRDLQVRLLRVLQEKEFQRVGGNTTYKTDVRIIAASGQDLKESVKSGNFREDLFYRLNVVPMSIPPLRERKEDIPLLLEHFIKKFASETGRRLPDFSDRAWKCLTDYTYPGNVRELINITERLHVLCPEGNIDIGDLPEEILMTKQERRNIFAELPENGVKLKDAERELILKTLRKTGGNKQSAARMLGITRRLLYLRLSEYGNPDGLRGSDMIP